MNQPSNTQLAEPKRKWRIAQLVVLVILALALPCVSGPRAADEPRVRAGVKLFRAFLAADLAIEGKAGEDGKLLLVVYAKDEDVAKDVAEQLARSAEGPEPATIRELPLQVERTSDPTLAAYADRLPAGVFIAEPAKDDTLQSVVRYGIAHRVIVYSPYEGHVEKGVLGGLSIEAKVQPFVNRATLDASHIELKPFFLRVAKVTE